MELESTTLKRQVGTGGSGPESPQIVSPSSVEDTAKSIWQLTEDVLELLRSGSRAAVHEHKRPDVPWLDELTETQGNTVITIRQLCETSPDGVTLKKLAEALGVTAAAASVMVDLLAKKKMLKRTRSRKDRRAILIRLTPEVAELFETSETTLLRTFACLERTMGVDTLRDWQRILMTANAALQQVVGTTPAQDDEECAGYDVDTDVGPGADDDSDAG